MPRPGSFPARTRRTSCRRSRTCRTWRRSRSAPRSTTVLPEAARPPRATHAAVYDGRAPRALVGCRGASSRRRPRARSGGSRTGRCSSIRDRWLGSEISARAEITHETASRRGTPAATSEPRATIWMTSVRVSEINSDLPRSLVKVSLTSLIVLTLPNCATKNSGCSARTPATALSADLSRRVPRCRSPVIWKSTSAAWRSSKTVAPPTRGTRVLRVNRRASRTRQPRARRSSGRSRLGTPGLHGQRLALDDHDLIVRPQVRVVQRLLRVVRLAREQIFAVDLVLGDSVAKNHGNDDKRDPSPDRELAVLSAPLSGAFGKTLRFHLI